MLPWAGSEVSYDKYSHIQPHNSMHHSFTQSLARADESEFKFKFGSTSTDSCHAERHVALGDSSAVSCEAASVSVWFNHSCWLRLHLLMKEFKINLLCCNARPLQIRALAGGKECFVHAIYICQARLNKQSSRKHHTPFMTTYLQSTSSRSWCYAINVWLSLLVTNDFYFQNEGWGY